MPFDLGPQFVRVAAGDRGVQRVDPTDPAFDLVLAEKVVEEQEGHLGPSRRRDPIEERVPEANVDPATR
jgi:hypothetical protein